MTFFETLFSDAGVVGLVVFVVVGLATAALFAYGYAFCTATLLDGTRVVKPSTMYAVHSATAIANTNGELTCSQPNSSGASACNCLWRGLRGGESGHWGKGEAHAWLGRYVQPAGSNNGVTYYVAKPPLTHENLIACVAGNLLLAIKGVKVPPPTN